MYVKYLAPKMLRILLRWWPIPPCWSRLRGLARVVRDSPMHNRPIYYVTKICEFVKFWLLYFLGLSCVATCVFCLSLLDVVAFSKKLRWFAQTKVISLKTQLHAVNARWKRLSQRSFNQPLNQPIFCLSI